LPFEIPIETDPENLIRVPLSMFSHQIGDTYTLTVMDYNNCTVTETIPEPPFGPSIYAQIGAKAVSCFNRDDGEITVTVSGGIPPYTINVLGQVATNVLTAYSDSVCVNNLVECNSSVKFANLRKGIYTVNVQSGDGCIFTQENVPVEQPPRIDYDEIKTHPVTCSGKANGSIHISNIRGAYLDSGVRRELFVRLCEGPEGFCSSPQRVHPEAATDYEGINEIPSRDVLESTIPFPGFSGNPNIPPYDDPAGFPDGTPDAPGDHTYMYRSTILSNNTYGATSGMAITGTLPDTDVVFNNLPAGCYTICIEDEFGCGIQVEAFVACPAPTKFML
jgi:hypothetical protein